MQRRYRSKALWASVLALLLFVLKTYFQVDLLEGDKLIDMILLVLTTAGIFNNPCDKDKF